MNDSQVPDFDTITSPPRRSNITYEAVKGGELIDSGGQATVKRVSIPGPDPPDTVAVKQPQTPSKTLDRDVIESFFEEADTWAKLAKRERTDQHRDTDHIVGIVATGENLPWLAMEYMDGGSLADRLDSNPNGLPVDEALWIAECVGKGLKFAHDNGVAHLDLKPANILFRETPGEKWDVPKIADWGLARSLLADSQSMDMLSVEYAAPEQFNPNEFGKPDSYTDIYQLGVIIYEMLTGELPYTGAQPEIMHSVIYGDEPDPPSSHREQLSHAVDDIVLKTLSTEKPQRYRGSVDRLVDAIRDIRHSANGSTDPARTGLWPTFQSDASRTGYRPHASAPDPPITKKWQFKTGNLIDSSPAVVDGTVFVGSDNGNLYAVDTTTGEERWHFETGDYIMSSPAVADGTVFVGSGDHNLYAVDANTGEEVWHFETRGLVETSPVVTDGTVFVGSNHSDLYAVDANSGEEVWQFETRNTIVSSPAAADGTVFVGSGDHNLYAVDATTGEEVWQFETRNTITSVPAVADGTVFVGSLDHNLYAVDATTGEERWQFETGARILSSPAVADSTVFVGSNDDNLYAVNASTGEERWRFETKVFVVSSPAVVDGTVFVGSLDHNLYAVDATTGEERWQFAIGNQILSSPAVVDGTVFVGSDDGNLYAVSEE